MDNPDRGPNMKWTSEVNEALSKDVGAIAAHLVRDLQTEATHIVDALLVTTDMNVDSGYAVHSKVQNINFPLELASCGVVSLPLLMFKVLMVDHIHYHFGWITQIVANMRAAVLHRPFSQAELALETAHSWFRDVSDCATILTWIMPVGRTDLKMVVSKAAQILKLVYGTREAVQLAVADATLVPITMSVDSAWFSAFRDTVIRAEVPMCAVAAEPTCPDFLVSVGGGTIGLICDPRDVVLIVILMMFSSEVNLIDGCPEGTPPRIAAFASAVRSSLKNGARVPVQYT